MLHPIQVSEKPPGPRLESPGKDPLPPADTPPESHCCSRGPPTRPGLPLGGYKPRQAPGPRSVLPSAPASSRLSVPVALSATRQVVESKEAGAAGVIGIVTSVLGRGTPIITQFAAAIGERQPHPLRRRLFPLAVAAATLGAPRLGCGQPLRVAWGPPCCLGISCLSNARTAPHASCPLTLLSWLPGLDTPVEVVNLEEMKLVEQ